MNPKQELPDFDEYLRQGEPGQRDKAANWQTAIGLQAVDGLTPSGYLVDVARRNIEGEIGLDEVDTLIKSYYESRIGRIADNADTEEADRAAANINRILSTRTLDFSVNGLVSLHRRIFDGVFKFAGTIRDYDISKREWVLRGQSVAYLNYQDLRAAIEYDLRQEEDFDYKDLTLPEMVSHIARFVAGLWQIHPFGEGNTRTTAVFTIQYLRSIGFDVENDLFARHSWYFRNALVRANYKNAKAGINYTFTFLEAFFRNLLMGETNELKNRHLLIDAPEEWPSDRTSTEQAPSKLHLLADQVPPEVKALVSTIGKELMTVKEMMSALGLRHRMNFMENYLDPTLSAGFVQRLYPDSPRHPRQKYRLSVKGLALFNSPGSIPDQPSE